MTEHIDVEQGSMDALVGQAANEFLEELEHGGDPHIDDYVRRYPDIGSVLREVLGVLEAMRPPREDPVQAVVGPAGPDRGLGRLGDFHILREIGRGGMGVVYEAEQLSLGRRVALKVLPAAAAMDAKRLQRFRNEAQAAAHLHHQNIVPVHAVGRFGSMHYYAMQYIEGQTLGALIRDLRRTNVRDIPTGFPCTTKPLDPNASDAEDGATALDVAAAEPQAANAEATAPFVCEPEKFAAPEPDSTPNPSSVLPSDSSTHSRQFFRTVARLGAQAADALEHAHSMGIVHRDIKPSNILLDLRGNLWITDFGLAHIHGDTQLTTTGDIIGTLRYMSPEQAFAKRGLLDQRTDVYSLGVTLYELATLEPAFNSEDRQELLHQIAFAEPKRPRKINRSVPRDLETILLKAIAKDPSGRYPTAQEMADDLKRFLADEPIQARRPTPLQKAAKWCRRHKAVVSTAAGVAIVGLVATALVAWVGKAREQVLFKNEQEARKNEQEAHRQVERKLDLAWAAFNDMYLQGQKLLQYEPHKEEVRKAFLDKALKFYREFVREPAADPDGRFRRAQAFHRIAEIQCGRGSFGEDYWYSEGKSAAQAQAASRAILMESVKSSKEAVAQLQALASEFPQTASYANEIAETHMTRGQALESMLDPRLFHEAEEAYRTAASCFEKLAAALPEQNEYRARLAACELAIARLHPMPQPAEFQARDTALSRARDLLQELLGKDPKNVAWRNSLASVQQERGRLLAEMGKPQQAEQVLRTAARMLDELSVTFKLLPESNYDVQQTYLSLGSIYSIAGKSKEAEDCYQRARDAGEKLVAGNPKVPRFHAGLATAFNGLAELRFRRHDLNGARELAEKAVRHVQIAHEGAQDNWNYRFNIQRYCSLLGSALLALGEYRKAAESARWVSDIVPTCPYGGSDAALLYSGCADAAKTDSRLTNEERATLIKSYSDRVPGLIDRIIRNGAGWAELQNNAAWLLANFPDERVRNPKRAVEVATGVVKANPESGLWWNTLGVARYRAGDLNGAVAALEKASALNKGKEPSDQLFLAMSYWKLGKIDRARKLYNQAIALMKTVAVTAELRRFREEADALLGKPQSASLPGRAKP
jgi:serine/threonine protein kinase/predicted Zn-dependent protease